MSLFDDAYDFVSTAFEVLVKNDKEKSLVEDALEIITHDYNLDRKSIANYILKKDVTPLSGSIVVCNLSPIPLSTICDICVEHTGIYVGDGSIIHRSGDGYIEKVTPDIFLKRLNGWNDASEIYVSCNNSTPLINTAAHIRAMLALNDNSQKGYDLFNKNCHSFTRYCLTGVNENDFFDFTFSSLEELLRNKFNMTSWNRWKFR